jgi:transposase
MLQVTPQMRVLVAVEPADFRCGIDGLARRCRKELEEDPFSGTVFVFRNRRRTGIKILVYDGQGFWLCYKRLSKSRFRWWPSNPEGPISQMQAHELQILIRGGNPTWTHAAPDWRPIRNV